MTEVFFNLLQFFLKVAIVSVAVIAVGTLIVSAMRAPSEELLGTLRVTRINRPMRDLSDTIRSVLLGDKEWKELTKRRKKEDEEENTHLSARPSVFVVDFKGDVGATDVRQLRHQITAILGAATDRDEVVVRLESPGGVVHGYGLAASQLARVRDRSLRLTVCIDLVAASGGYMMACVANQIVAAPFAIVGSIGVVIPVPNAHRWLKERGIDYDEMTAGTHKRTVSTFGENTAEGRAKLQEQLDDTHLLFKEHILSWRPALDMAAVSTGEYWYASRARQLGLVDTIQTSDDYLLSRMPDHNVVTVTFEPRQSWTERASESFRTIARTLLRP